MISSHLQSLHTGENNLIHYCLKMTSKQLLIAFAQVVTQQDAVAQQHGYDTFLQLQFNQYNLPKNTAEIWKNVFENQAIIDTFQKFLRVKENIVGTDSSEKTSYDIDAHHSFEISYNQLTARTKQV